jgi:hypothetical protein
MKKEFINYNYAALRAGDMVVCTSSSLFAMLIRGFSTGWKNWKNYKIANHTGLIVEANGQKFVAEMLGKGLDVNSLESYNKKNNPAWIIDIKRNSLYDDPEKRLALNDRVFNDLRHTLDYDIKGLIEFIIKKVKDDKSKFYCSEYFMAQTAADGVVYPSMLSIMVSPEDLNQLESWYSVPNWKLKLTYTK